MGQFNYTKFVRHTYLRYTNRNLLTNVTIQIYYNSHSCTIMALHSYCDNVSTYWLVRVGTSLPWLPVNTLCVPTSSCKEVDKIKTNKSSSWSSINTLYTLQNSNILDIKEYHLYPKQASHPSINTLTIFLH